jgi:hypothetical protein
MQDDLVGLEDNGGLSLLLLLFFLDQVFNCFLYIYGRTEEVTASILAICYFISFLKKGKKELIETSQSKCKILPFFSL